MDNRHDNMCGNMRDTMGEMCAKVGPLKAWRIHERRLSEIAAQVTSGTATAGELTLLHKLEERGYSAWDI